MRMDAIRTFAAGYHGESPGKRFSRTRTAWPVASARVLFAVVGLALAVTGVIVARSGIDPYIGLALVIVGAFLLILPMTRARHNE
jgi:peptidoglycan/LPS O-acetylase OafA/YrhL